MVTRSICIIVASHSLENAKRLHFRSSNLDYITTKLARALTYAMATEPSVPFASVTDVERRQEDDANLPEPVTPKEEERRSGVSSPIDGEGKEASDVVNSEVDAEGEEIDDEYTETYVGSIMPAETPISEAALDVKSRSVPSSPSVSDASSMEEEADSSDTGSSSDNESQWAEESDAAEEAELEDSDGNRCL